MKKIICFVSGLLIVAGIVILLMSKCSHKSESVYLVQWVNYDGETLSEESYKKGETPLYKGNIPTRDSDDDSDYYFAGWDPEVTVVTKNQTYTATFDKITGTGYIINFDLDGGSSPSYVAIKEVEELSPDIFFFDVTKEGYTFKGWSYNDTLVIDENGEFKQTIELVDNMTFKAVYEILSYTITWKNYDGSLIASDTYNHGETPVYNHEIPTKPSDDEYTYSFAGWTPEIEIVTSDQEYVATYNNIKKYTIHFNLNGGSTSSNTDDKKVAELTSDIFFFDVTKEGYTFKGWSYNEILVIDENGTILEAVELVDNMTFVATYEQLKFTVTWKNYDGTFIGSEKYAYGDTPEFLGASPHRENDEEFTYRFIGWDHEFEIVKSDQEYIAQYESTPVTNTYVVTWKNDLGAILLSEECGRGWIPEYHLSTPVSERQGGNEPMNFTFKNWDKELKEVTEDVTYTAVYDEELLINYRLNENNEIVLCDNAHMWEAFDLEIPSSVNGVPITEIADSCFLECWSMASLVIPDSVETIGNEAFKGCVCLANVEIGDGLTSIASNAFLQCTALKTITLGKNVTSIDDGAFMGCTSLESISLNDGLETIGKEAFKNCTALRSIELPDSVTSLGESAFNNCPSLSTLTFGSGLTSIGSEAFVNCTALTYVTIPESVTVVGSKAFENCFNLTITVEVSEKPDGWAENWNPSNRPVNWKAE